MVTRPPRIAIATIALLVTLGTTALLAGDPERSRAESELSEVLQEIALLQQELQESRRDQRREQERLRQLDLAIQRVDRRLRALGSQRSHHEGELHRLERERQHYLDSLDQRLAQLAEQVRSAYRNSTQSRMKLVLNQDDPTLIGRMLAYYDYISQAQMARIEGLREAVTRLEAMQAGIDAELARIAGLAAEQQTTLDALAEQRRSRLELARRIEDEIGDSESALRELEKNRRDLEALIDRLSSVLADIPEDLEHQTSVAQRKGRLPMPVNGPVRHAFGQDRGGSLDWQGWLIGAGPGTEVQAVAYGRVAYADWLRGYGLLMVIDHGDGFMTLYGHNESLLHDAGEWVAAGEVISVVGSNPGDSQGSYFEIRRDGKAVDPAAWLAR